MKRFISIILASLMSSLVLAQGYVQHEIHSVHTPFGIPIGAPLTSDLIFRHAYTLSSNDETKLADWVAYKVDKKNLNSKKKGRRRFKKDPFLTSLETLEKKDYSKAHKVLKVDRGHLTPLGSFTGTDYAYETNYLSNIVPQNSRLNRGLWRKLEHVEREWAKKMGRCYVITGPIYSPTAKHMSLPKADERHRVPDKLFKIVYLYNGKKLKSLETMAFIFDQSGTYNSDLYHYITTIDQVEKETGLDFFSSIEDKKEAEIESIMSVF